VEVGIRELRNQLSRHLAAVREGQELVVTDHGRAVARIIPLDRPRTIDRLVAEGLVRPATARDRTLPRRVKARGGASDLVAEQRR
jgi:prevent-host-death family protein